ncbi:MAG: heparan-alpha-glucosaminide N-acetyltransferase domain-containing protein [Ferruginibacter sp.]
MKRLQSIDLIRGAVMIIMALDHVRDLMHVNSLTQIPTNLATTTPLLFFTRFITYFCAPTFVFLAGTSAFLNFKRYNNLLVTRKYLISRGLALIFIEFTIVNFGMFFDLGFHTFIFEVIATIGFGFVILGLLLPVPSKVLGIIGLLIIFTHNLYPMLPFDKGSAIGTIISQFFLPGATPFGPRVFVMAYPPIPWLGIMLCGFATGNIFALPVPKRKEIFLWVGVSALVVFAIVRYLNFYGDPLPFTVQPTTVYTSLSFINLTKYPPSLLFCLVTLGILFIAFATFSGSANNKIAGVLSVYGKTPMFYFLVHFYLIHVLMVVMLFIQGFHWTDLNFASGNFGRSKNVKSGLGLGAVYLLWLFVVIALYKPCMWYAKYKATHKHWWLRYI